MQRQLRRVVFLYLTAILLFIFFYTNVHHPSKQQSYKTLSKSEQLSIISKTTEMNKMQKIYNEDKFGPIKPDTIIIVVQVHNRLQDLINALKALENAKFIEETLIIFSHSIYDDQINAVIQGIQFAKVMQIFYPYSMQMYPDTFPGDDPNDCPRDISQQRAIEIQCNNAEYPDLYGHYRTASYSQTKHHWWWKNNFIFDGLHVTRNHSGMLLILEEDYYVLPDILHMLKLVIQLQPTHCPQCNFIYMGNDPANIQYQTYSTQIDVYFNLNTDYKRGIALTKATWRKFQHYATEFCTYDDYNWDFTLKYMGKSSLSGQVQTMAVAAARVIHASVCGFHFKNSNCSADKKIQEINGIINANRRHLFPTELTFKEIYNEGFDIKPNGGWGDKRDHSFCLNMTDLTIPNK